MLTFMSHNVRFGGDKETEAPILIVVNNKLHIVLILSTEIDASPMYVLMPLG